MPLDAVFLTGLRRELEGDLTGSRIDRITMPERDLVLLQLHGPAGKRKLLLSARSGSARLHFTTQSFENPPQPPMFCMLLRKYLLGARIAAVQQPPMERLVTLELDTRDELGVASRQRLVLELMGKCRNLVLVGEDGRVLGCLHKADFETNEKRPLLPGLFYAEPPRQEKPGFFDVSEEELRAVWESIPPGQDADKALLDTFSGLSPLICREIAAAPEPLEAMAALRRRVAEGAYEPTMLLEGERPRDFSFMPIGQYGERCRCVPYESFSALLDDFYTLRDKQDGLRRRGAELTRTVKTARDRLVRKEAARLQELKATEKQEEYRRRGDLITANLYRLQRGMSSFEAEDFYEEGCPTVTVPLDPLKTPQQNAAANYRLYTKARHAAGVLAGLIAEAREEREYLESVLDELERATQDRDLSDIRRELTAGGYLRAAGNPRAQKLPAPRRPMRFVTSAGREVLVGRGNAENDELTTRTARRTDLWFHVQKLPGSHVVLSQTEGEADAESIRQAAILAATFSRSGGGKTAVDYTQVRHVKKPSGARPGRVIYTDYATLIVEPDPALAERLRAEK